MDQWTGRPHEPHDQKATVKRFHYDSHEQLRLLPVASDFIESVESAALSAEDVLGGIGLGETPQLGIVLRQVVADGGPQVVDAGVTAAPDALCRDFSKKPFDEVEA